MNEFYTAAEGTNRYNETRVIGLEMRLRNHGGMPFEEMEVFPCKYTLHSDHIERPEIQITVHTSRGDVTLQGMLP